MIMFTFQRATNLFYATLILFAMSTVLGLLGWTVAGSLGLFSTLSLGTAVLVYSSKLSTIRYKSRTLGLDHGVNVKGHVRENGKPKWDYSPALDHRENVPLLRAKNQNALVNAALE